MTTKQTDKKSWFENFADIIGWLQIVVSPLLIGLVIGAIIYFMNPTPPGLVIGISVAIIGLIIGVIWATKVWKKQGTSHFISRIMATPELDPKEEKD
jgi:hypothetical protein